MIAPVPVQRSRAIKRNWTLSQYRDRLSRYGDSRVKDKTVARPSYLQHGDSYPGKTTSLYWDDHRVATQPQSDKRKHKIMFMHHHISLKYIDAPIPCWMQALHERKMVISLNKFVIKTGCLYQSSTWFRFNLDVLVWLSSWLYCGTCIIKQILRTVCKNYVSIQPLYLYTYTCE